MTKESVSVLKTTTAGLMPFIVITISNVSPISSSLLSVFCFIFCYGHAEVNSFSFSVFKWKPWRPKATFVRYLSPIIVQLWINFIYSTMPTDFSIQACQFLIQSSYIAAKTYAARNKKWDHIEVLDHEF